MSHILITGGAGFIGSHVTEQALKQGLTVSVIDNLLTGKRSNIAAFIDNIDFIEQDIASESASRVTAFDKADHLVHLAARISVPESLEIPEAYFTTNTLGTSAMCQLAQQRNVTSMVLASSAAVYGDNPELPKHESMLPEPKSAYAISKLDGEYLLNITAQQSTCRTVSLRFFNVFGPRQDPSSAYAAAVPIFIDRACRNQDIVIYGDGEQTRDFIYVEDIAKACLETRLRGNGVINAACGRSISIAELAQQIIDITGSQSKIEYASERAGDIKHSCADNQRFISELNIQPQADLRAGLEKTIDYFERTRDNHAAATH